VPAYAIMLSLSIAAYNKCPRTAHTAHTHRSLHSQCMSHVRALFSLADSALREVHCRIWFRKRTGLNYSWDTADFRENERPRPEFLRAFRKNNFWKAREEGGRGRMARSKGYFAPGGIFVADDTADDVTPAPQSSPRPRPHLIHALTSHTLAYL
jgi:hypothetical protein